MTLTELKAQAEKAKESDIELGFWREDISPDDVLRLVEVARAAHAVIATSSCSSFGALLTALECSLKDIEP